MKKSIFFLCFFCGTQVYSQDFVVLSTGDSLAGQITAVDEHFVNFVNEGSEMRIGLEYVLAYMSDSSWVQTLAAGQSESGDLLLQNQGPQAPIGPNDVLLGRPQGKFPDDRPVDRPYLFSGRLVVPAKIFQQGVK